MAYSKELADRIRQSLARVPDVEEKKIFGGLAFMIRAKMCLAAGAGQMMCRIDPDLHEIVTKKQGCQTVIMGGRKYKGWVYLNKENLQEEDDFNYWVNLALDFNKTICDSD